MKRFLSAAAAAVSALIPDYLKTGRPAAVRRVVPSRVKKTREDLERMAAAHAKRERKAMKRRQDAAGI